MELVRIALRDAGRRVARQKSWSALTAVGLGIALGFSGVVYSITKRVLLNPIPAVRDDSLFVVHSRWPSGLFSAFTYPQWRLIAQGAGFGTSAASGSVALPVRSSGRAIELRVAFVSAEYFRMLGLHLSDGRPLRPHDDREGVAPVAVLTPRALERLGTGRVGSDVWINGLHAVVVGVAPAGFSGLDLSSPIDAFVPLHLYTRATAGESGYLMPEPPTGWLPWLTIVGRLPRGLTPEMMSTRLSALAASPAWASASGTSDPSRPRMSVLPLQVAAVPIVGRHDTVAFVRAMTVFSALLVWAGILALVNMVVARGTERSRDLWIRMALGAPRWHVLASGLAEHAVLVSLASAGGIISAEYLVRVLLPLRLPIETLQLDLREVASSARLDVVATVAVVALVVLLASTGTVLLRTWRARSTAGRDDGNWAGHPFGGGRINFLVASSQVALAIIGVATSLVLFEIARSMRSLDPGFAIDDRLTVSFEAPRYAPLPEAQVALDRIRMIPGVLAAEVSTRRFGVGADSARTFSVDGAPLPSPVRLELSYGGPEYLSVAGIRVSRGRGLDERDRARPVAVLNEAAAAALFPRAAPIGHRVAFSLHGKTVEVLVVGVAANTALFDVREASLPVAYLPIALHPTARAARHFVVRTVPGGASGVMEVVSNRLSVLAPDVPVAVRSHRELVNSCTQRERSLASMLAVIAAATTGLAVMSIAALLALELQRRRREVAMRIVLGASARSLLGTLSGRSAQVLAVGGTLGALGTRTLTSLVGSPAMVPAWLETASLAAACAVVGASVIVTTVVPVLRAVRVDPMAVLRQE